jgi:hypothetical protein
MPNKKDAIETAISRLKDSPLFNVSLSSKELFHSDFLYWLCKSYPEEVIPIFAQWMPVQPDLSRGWTVDRESARHDLSFKFGDGQVLILENKVKSTPTEVQLQSYSGKFHDKPGYSFLLLSLVNPAFADVTKGIVELRDGSKWALMDYAVLAEGIKAILPIVERRDDYHGKLLADYVEFISLLNTIAKDTAITPANEENFFSFKEFMPSLRALRIHDLVYKRVYSDMAQIVTEGLVKKGAPVCSESNPEKSGASGDIFIDSGFSNGTGMFTANYVVRDGKEPGGPCIVFVQLQDQMFRLFFYSKDNRHSEQIARKLADKELWFNFNKLEPYVVKRKRERKEFNNYYGTHLYRYELIDNIPPRTLADITIQYIDQAKESAGRIREILDRAT